MEKKSEKSGKYESDGLYEEQPRMKTPEQIAHDRATYDADTEWHAMMARRTAAALLSVAELEPEPKPVGSIPSPTPPQVSTFSSLETQLPE